MHSITSTDGHFCSHIEAARFMSDRIFLRQSTRRICFNIRNVLWQTMRWTRVHCAATHLKVLSMSVRSLSDLLSPGHTILLFTGRGHGCQKMTRPVDKVTIMWAPQSGTSASRIVRAPDSRAVGGPTWGLGDRRELCRF